MTNHNRWLCIYKIFKGMLYLVVILHKLYIQRNKVWILNRLFFKCLSVECSYKYFIRWFNFDVLTSFTNTFNWECMWLIFLQVSLFNEEKMSRPIVWINHKAEDILQDFETSKWCLVWSQATFAKKAIWFWRPLVS